MEWPEGLRRPIPLVAAVPQEQQAHLRLAVTERQEIQPRVEPVAVAVVPMDSEPAVEVAMAELVVEAVAVAVPA